MGEHAIRVGASGQLYPATQESETYEPPEHEAELRKLLGNAYTAGEVAAIVYAYRIYELEFLTYLQQTRGNAFVRDVESVLMIAETIGLDQVDHTAGVQGRGFLAHDGVETAVDKTAPDPTEALPYDGKGGWDAVLINTRLGQVDRIKETNSDGDRCAFATSLAAQIFVGPAAVASWSAAFAAQSSAYDTGRPGAAKGVIAAVSAAVTSGRATYGDLAWMQEALHDVALSQDHAGTKTSFEAVATEVEDYTEMTEKTCTTAEQVRTAATKLAPGERMMVEWHAERKDLSGDIDHQLMLYNDAGLLYLYDPQPFGNGVHLVELDAAGLAYYFNPKEFSKSVLSMAGKVTPKAK